MPRSTLKFGTHDHVWLVRHGHCHGSTEQPSLHPRTIGLTDLGQSQADLVCAELDTAPAWVAVSGYERTLATAEPLLQRYPNTPVHTWPIEPLSYLGVVQHDNATDADRREWAHDYWRRGDPHLVNGEGAETFVQFMKRVADFAERLRSTPGFGVVFGHGSFLMAYLIALEHGFDATRESMARFATIEASAPLTHGCIVAMHRARLSRPWVQAQRMTA